MLAPSVSPSPPDAEVPPQEADLAEGVRATLDEAELKYENPEPGRFLVTLPGEHKLTTMCWLIVGKHALQVEAFVMRKPDEGAEEIYRLLMQRNQRSFAVAWSLDKLGDIYLSARLPLSAVNATDIDQILGAVLASSDDTFDTLVEMGFESAIRKEWEWRISRGESTVNLAAFEHLRPAPSD